MAKINARGTRQKGLTYFTERVRPAAFDGDHDRVYYEAWRLRSDGWIQSRIVSTRPVEPGEGRHETKHSSGFTNWRRFKKGEQATPVDLEALLASLGATVVKRR